LSLGSSARVVAGRVVAVTVGPAGSPGFWEVGQRWDLYKACEVVVIANPR
jgi:hypothetical protein